MHSELIYPMPLQARMGNWHWRRDLHSSRVSWFPWISLPNFLKAKFSSKIVYIAPSGVQKERIKPTDIFVLPYPQPSDPHADRIFLRRPTSNLKESACTPLFWNSFDLRDAGSCIHTHSQHAVMATLLWEGEVFKISHQEMIKGVRVAGTGKALSYLDTLVLPIIENTPNEEDLKDSMADAMKKYPDAAGVLVRRHGVYVWGESVFTFIGPSP